MNAEPTADDLFAEVIGLDSDMDDRSCAIVQASRLESSLQEVLLKRMVQLSNEEIADLFTDPAAPLFSLSSKIGVGYAIGAFGPNTRADLDRIRHVRNPFAHARTRIHFATPEIASVCQNLRGQAEFVPLPPIVGSKIRISKTEKHSARIQYENTIWRLSSAFIYVISSA
jgi:hypothetical protein